MASLARRLHSNAPGDIYVDDSCIDCGTCRWMAPQVFDHLGGTSRVHTQPVDGAGTAVALQALVACPTGSIGARRGAPIKVATASFPRPFGPPGVHHCGFHSRESFGATAWLITRPQGNVLVDSPRFAAPLVRRLEALGGVRWMVLSHRDDVADHARFAEHFGCERVLHADEVGAVGPVERIIDGQAPVALDDELLVIPTPGHTKGGICLLWQGALFTGDTLAWSLAHGRPTAFRRACWFSWPTLIDSIAELRGHAFEWILPGHGAPGRSDDMTAALDTCLAWMRTQ